MRICDIFNLFGENHKFTEEYIYNNKGKYPVYSATLNKPYGYVHDCDYSKENENSEMLLVVNYGVGAGKIRYINGDFNIGRNISGLVLKDEYKKNNNLKYIGLILEKIFRQEIISKGMGCFSQKAILNFEIPYPFPKKSIQDEIVEKYEIIDEIECNIKKLLNKINTIIQFEYSPSKYLTYKMSEIAILNKGSNKISEEMIYNNYDKDGIPVYSSATENNGLMGKVTKECFLKFNKKGKKNELTWTTNGYAGVVFLRDSEYLYSEKCGRIIIRKEFLDKINPKYLYYILNQITYKYKTSESNNGKLDIIHMSNIPIRFPVDEFGNISIYKQNIIVEQYDKLENMKNKLEIILTKINELL